MPYGRLVSSGPDDYFRGYADGKNPGETDYGNALGTVPGNKNDVGSIGDAGNPGSTYANEAAGNA